MTLAPRRTIAIIGAGFCGSVLAGRLLRDAFDSPTRIVLIERGADFARGAAYARRDFPYLLNVAAAQMSAVPEVPDEFLQFARLRVEDADAGDFLPRALYGDYLEDRLRLAEEHAHQHARLVRLRGAVRGLERSASGRAWALQLDDGRELIATDVVLATGNPPAMTWQGARTRNDLLSPDPWDLAPGLDAARSVLLVGSGLTSCDMVMRACASEAREITVLSTHGLLPLRQGDVPQSQPPAHADSLVTAARGSARATLRAARQLARQVQAAGGYWQEAVAAIRDTAPRVWAALPEREQARFLRHAQSVWNVHRHRLPPQVAARIDVLRAAGALRVHAARLLELEREGLQVRARWQPRAGGAAVDHVADVVVNCTGPNFRIDCSAEPLMRALRSAGLVSADVHGLGLRTDGAYRVVDASGTAQAGLFYVGPLLRATYWEATAVPELRRHVRLLARRIALDC